MNWQTMILGDYCVNDSLGTYKPLSKIYRTCSGWRPEETIMLDNSTQALRDNPQNGIVAIDFAEPHLEGDIYLYLLTDILRESLPKTRVYQFVDRVNQVMPYVVSLYQMGDNNYRKQDLKQTLKIHPGAIENGKKSNGLMALFFFPFEVEIGNWHGKFVIFGCELEMCYGWAHFRKSFPSNRALR